MDRIRSVVVFNGVVTTNDASFVHPPSTTPPAPLCLKVGAGYARMGGSNMISTRSACIDTCERLGPLYSFASVRPGRCDCFYPNEFVALLELSNTRILSNSECNAPCPGDSTKMCGGATGSDGMQILSVLKMNLTNVAGEKPAAYEVTPDIIDPTPVSTPKTCLLMDNSWDYSPYMGRDSGFPENRDACTTYCANYPIALVTNSGGTLGQTACYCYSDTSIFTRGKYIDPKNCIAPCSGNKAQFCGGYSGNLGTLSRIASVVKNTLTSSATEVEVIGENPTATVSIPLPSSPSVTVQIPSTEVDGMPGFAIALIVLGSVIVFALAIIVVLLLTRKGQTV